MKALTLIDILLALAIWAVVIIKARPALRHDRRTLATWAFMVGLAISLTLKVPVISQPFNAWIGIPNLNWLLSYIAIVVAMYSNALGCQALLQEPVPRWLLPSLLVTLAGLVGIFVLGIAPTTEYPDHTFPRTLTDVLFMNLTYLYCAVLVLRIHHTFVRLARIERNDLARFRWQLIRIATVTGSGFCWARMLFVLLAYLHAGQPLLHSIDLFGDIMLLLTCLILPSPGQKSTPSRLAAPPAVAGALALAHLPSIHDLLARAKHSHLPQHAILADSTALDRGHAGHLPRAIGVVRTLDATHRAVHRW